MILHGGAKLISLLLILFNGILNSGHFPDSWKEVKIKMLAKAGKNKSIPGSYRPITLSSCVGKLFEKSLKSRIKAMMRRLRAENENQAAYKKRRLCQEHTVHLTQTVSQALNERKCVLLFMLDVKGAFDKLWNRGLIYKLHSWGLSTRLLRCVASFMRERSLRVHEGTAKSRVVNMLAGTPQGSIVSPLLFILFMDDLKDELPDGVRLYQFADDISLSVVSSCPRAAEWLMQRSLEAIEKWTARWRIELEPSKSNFIVFSRCPTHRKLRLNLKLHGEKMKESDDLRFLGIRFDKRLDWSKQVEELIAKTNHKIHLLKCISAKDRWANPREVLKFVDAIVTSVFAFATPCCITMKSSLWAKLDAIHARAVKSIAGVANFVGYERVCNQLGIERWSSALKSAAFARIEGILKDSPHGAEMLQSNPKGRQTYDSPISLLLDHRRRILQLQQPTATTV